MSHRQRRFYTLPGIGGQACAEEGCGVFSAARAVVQVASGFTWPGLRARKRPASRRAFSGNDESRQRPTLPRSHPRSTIGAEGLNDRVRNGNGCGPLAMITGKNLTE